MLDRLTVIRNLGRLVLAALCIAFVSGVAQADNVDRLISRLKSNNYKVRLSAALSLSKVGNARAIRPLIRALRDRNKSVRGVAAASLGKLVKSRTPRKLRRSAVSALKRVSTQDSDRFVRNQAAKAYASVSGGSSSGKGSKVYIDVGTMSVKSGGAAMRRAMRRAVTSSFASKAREMTTSWPGRGRPTASAIRSRGMKAFHIDGSVVSLRATPRGSGMVVTCKVKMLMASFPDKSMFAFPSGGAKVQTSNAGVNSAKEKCVAAVVKALVGSKVIPLFRQRARY